jgi:hypothetical protein
MRRQHVTFSQRSPPKVHSHEHPPSATQAKVFAAAEPAGIHAARKRCGSTSIRKTPDLFGAAAP